MYILNFIRGFCMALADSVPGVSGGTIAFILGFYDDFVNALNNIISNNKIDRMCEDSWRWQSNNPNGYETIEKEVSLTNE